MHRIDFIFTICKIILYSLQLRDIFHRALQFHSNQGNDIAYSSTKNDLKLDFDQFFKVLKMIGIVHCTHFQLFNGRLINRFDNFTW